MSRGEKWKCINENALGTQSAVQVGASVYRMRTDGGRRMGVERGVERGIENPMLECRAVLAAPSLKRGGRGKEGRRSRPYLTL